LADDIVQETGARLWKRRTQIDLSRPLEPLANTIATNLMRDHIRKQKWITTDVDLAATPLRESVEGEVLARDEIKRVGSAFAKLSLVHRKVLADSLEAEPTRAPASVRMMRMRARQKLRVLLDDGRDFKDGCLVALHKGLQSMRMRLRIGDSPMGALAGHAAGAMVVLVGAALVNAPSNRATVISQSVPHHVRLPAVALSGQWRAVGLLPPSRSQPAQIVSSLRGPAKDATAASRGSTESRVPRPLARLGPAGTVRADSRGATIEPGVGDRRPIEVRRDQPIRDKICHADKKLTIACGPQRKRS
jgi:hypothetical protein